MTIQETSFVFKREGEQFKMSEARFSNGSRFKSPKVATAMQSFLAQTPERDKVSQCQELQVTLDPSALSLLRIQNRENGLDITVNGAVLASLAGEISSCSQKPEIVRQFLKEMQEKDSVKKTEAQYSLKTLMDRVERLLNSDDPIVERVLDHILAQREAFLASPDLREKMNQLYLEVDAVLRHLEIKELQRNFGVAEARLVGSKKAFAHATQSLTIKLKDLKDFMRPDTQKCRLDMIVNMPGFGRPNLEANIREAEENIALFEDLLPVRTEAEQKAKLNECVAELAGEPYFQDLLKFVKTVNEVFALFDQINNAWAVQKPYLFAKLMTYVSLKSDMEKIMPLLPQRSARKFGFCFADVLLSGAKIILPEVLLKEFPDLRQACAEEIQMCRQSIVGYRARQAEMELRDRQSELLRTIGRDIQELETLCLNSSESKEAIAALEEREYTLTGTMILRERFRNVPQDHPINQMLGQLGEAELEEAQAGFGKALRALDAERSVLFNTIRMQPSAKALLE